MTEVLTVLSAISSQLDGLIETLPSQCEVLESRDVERITRLVEERSLVIGAMVEISEQVPGLLDGSKDDPAVRALIQQVEGKLEVVLEADRKAEAVMVELTRDLGGQLRQANTTLVARDVYKPTAAGQPAARFSDREG